MSSRELRYEIISFGEEVQWVEMVKFVVDYKWSAREKGILYFEKQNVLYVPIPKCATTTISLLLIKQLGIKPAKEQWKTLLPVVLVSEIHNYVGRLPTFTVVRHPRKRIESCWLQKVKEVGRCFLARNNLDSQMGFDDFVNWTCDQNDCDRDRHIKTQWSFVTADTGESICSEIVDMSTIDRDIPKILPGVRQVPRRNKVKNRPIIKWNDKTYKRFVSAFKVDFEMLRYVP